MGEKEIGVISNYSRYGGEKSHHAAAGIDFNEENGN